MYYNDNTIVYYNGKFLKASEANIDLYGQSLHYGYSVFEGIKSYETNEGTQVFKAQEHYDRLRRSAELLHIPFEYSTQELIDLTYELLERNQFTNAYIRPLVVCPPNMSLSKGKESHLILLAWEWSNGYLGDKMKVMTSSFQRPNPQAFLIEAKVGGHYVNSILACQEAKDNGYDEAILLDEKGYVAESSGANIFYEKEGELFTPAKGSILPGITRSVVIDICKELEIPVHEKFFTPEEMRGADAAFFCGTAAEIVALDSMDNVRFAKEWDESLCSLIQKSYKNRVVGKSINEFKNKVEENA
ncbi:branched-chain amino acid transaminase [Chryseobacterium potabilaquae]|uniref:Branched-chain-amino-acid aminotransferase n=1 Tax=Chryseobacterium potabilaquae TaxID=2675057 RepID=A0A6N4X1S5_9FLAO|nr:branched-chain amino acid transaminase [Chryseobacterium potabilaquae]CAA7193763.1 Branched-chain-amino-acid aminotransferase [Chryseobacterium potabilaquae]